MSRIIGFVGMSHSPFATLLPPDNDSGPGSQFLADAERVAAAVTDLAPDVLVVIGPDHFHANFYDVMPPFVFGVEEAEGFGDFGTEKGKLPVASDLAWSLHGAVTAAGFDVALSYALTVDHGIVQTYSMITGKNPVPLVPIVVNTAAPPLPSLTRCVALGRALGDAIRAAPMDADVLVVASGGLSHWLPSNDPRDETVTGQKRRDLIHGRKYAESFAAEREPRVKAMGGQPDARVHEEWDRWFLDRVAVRDLESVIALGDAGLEENAGTGGHEIRTWLIGSAAAQIPLTWTAYEAVPEWVTGMGIGTSVPVPSPAPTT